MPLAPDERRYSDAPVPIAPGAPAPPLPMQEAGSVDAASQPGIFRNSAINIAGLVFANGFGALAGLLVARTLGAEAVGILAVAIGLVEFGRTLSNFTHGPSIIAYHRDGEAAGVFGTSLILKGVGAGLWIALAFLTAPWIEATFHIPAWAFLLASLTLAVGIPYEIGVAWLEADNLMLRRNAVMLTGPVVNLAIVVGLVFLGDLSVRAVIVASLAGTLAMSFAASTRIVSLRLQFDAPTARWMAVYGFQLLATAILTQALIWTDTLMISALVGNSAAGIYNVIYQLTFLMVTASAAIGTALMPALSSLAGRGLDTSAGYARGTLLTLSLSAILAVGYVLAGPFVLALYGPEFTAGYPALLVLIVFGLAAALAVPPGSLLAVHGHARAMVWLGIGQVLLNTILNYVLIRQIGILGAAIASTVAAVLGLVTIWWLAHRYTGAWPLNRVVLREAWALLSRRAASGP